MLLNKHCSSLNTSVDDLIGVGLAISATVSIDDFVVDSSTLPSWTGVSVIEVFSQVVNYPIHIENESHCAAFAEMMWGITRNTPNFTLFKFDLGVGGGIVIDGALRSGANRIGGGFGHIPLQQFMFTIIS
jgi:predicted NBD/HSP70 family sugar kinase